jgi:hypothetical protein
MTKSESDGQLPDDLLAPDGEDADADAEDDDSPGIEGDEHFGLTPPD